MARGWPSSTTPRRVIETRGSETLGEAFRRRRALRTRALAVLLALAVPAIALAPVVASGEPKKSGNGAPPQDKHDPQNVTSISRYMETIAKGNERYVAKDFTAAIDTYKKAAQLAPKHPLAHYLLAEAYLQSSNFGEAEAAITAALEAPDAKSPALRSRVLFLAAEIQERQKKWEPAKTAWQAYAEHAASFSDAGFPQTSAERIKALQKVIDMAKAYVGVRERVATEKAESAKAGAGKK